MRLDVPLRPPARYTATPDSLTATPPVSTSRGTGQTILLALPGRAAPGYPPARRNREPRDDFFGTSLPGPDACGYLRGTSIGAEHDAGPEAVYNSCREMQAARGPTGRGDSLKAQRVRQPRAEASAL